MTTPTIRPAEAEHFGALAADWWDPKGRSAMLHRINPARLGYIRDQIDRGLGTAVEGRHPLTGRRALDVGCGGGLVAEPLARLGATVTGVDASPDVIAVARAHAAAVGLVIDYRAGEVAELLDEPDRFGLVTALEVVEHVDDVPAFVAALAGLLGPGGMLILSTPARTARSRLMTIGLAETFGAVPRGTHNFDRFLTPEAVAELMKGAGLEVVDQAGLEWSPFRGFRMGGDLSLNHFTTARKPG